jgi:hypothetical protein
MIQLETMNFPLCPILLRVYYDVIVHIMSDVLLHTFAFHPHDHEYQLTPQSSRLWILINSYSTLFWSKSADLTL